MPYIKTLEVLNDCNENQKILLKLPDWLVSRWKRKAMEARQAYSEYPPFKEFVHFLSKEADLSCDPISSVQALKGVESDKPKYPRSHTIQAKLSLVDVVYQFNTEQHPIMHVLQKSRTCRR